MCFILIFSRQWFTLILLLVNELCCVRNCQYLLLLLIWLFQVLLASCKAMAPFTPFFTEVLYHNMRKVSNGSEESIHYCNFPEVEGKVPVLFFCLCFNKFISTGVFCLNDSSLQIVSMIILERWTHWRKCQQDDDYHWSCKEYPWASKQTSQNPIEVVLISFTCLVTWIDSFPTSVPPSNPTRMEYFHFSSYIS